MTVLLSRVTADYGGKNEVLRIHEDYRAEVEKKLSP